MQATSWHHKLFRIHLPGHFRKVKRLGIGRFLIKCPFWKNVFLNLNQKCQKQIRIRRKSIFTCPSWLPKCPFVKQISSFTDVKNLFPRIFSLNSFILNIFLTFYIFLLKYFYHIIHMSLFNTRGIIAMFYTETSCADLHLLPNHLAI